MTATALAEPASTAPSDILLNLIVTLLAPMFLGTCAGDIALARMAATETVNAYRTQNQADLIAIAQIVACGLAALGSLCLSMADDISLSMTLRLRGNAVALNRAAEQNRRAIKTRHADPASHQPIPDEAETLADIQYQAEVVANVTEAQKRVAEAQARLLDPQPAAPPAPRPVIAPAAPTTHAIPARPVPPMPHPGMSHHGMPHPGMTDQQKETLWAAAMSDVAAEFTATLPFLPIADRKLASQRAAALSSTANQLIAGSTTPTYATPRR